MPSGYPGDGYQPATAVPPSAVPVGRPQGVTPVGVALIITGAVSFVCALTWMFAGVSVLHDEVHSSSGFGGADVFAYVVLFSPVFSVFLSPATITGGIQMIRGKTPGLVMFGVIAALVPLSSCCYLAGLPVGIWGLMVARRPDVRDWFARGGGGAPQPAQYYQPWG